MPHNEKSIAERELSVKSKEEELHAQQKSLDKMYENLDVIGERITSREERLNDAAVLIEGKLNEFNVMKTDNARILQRITKENDREKTLHEATEAEVVKLESLSAKMRNENTVNKRIQAEMESKMPKMQSLIIVLREFQDYISAHMRNPDAIEQKFHDMFASIDISLHDEANVE